LTSVSIAISALVGLFGSLVVIRVHRMNAFRGASQKFVETISMALKDIYPVPANWPTNIHRFFEEKFPEIQAAVAAFETHLRGRKRTNFKKAWVNYYNAYGDERCQCYHHYMPFSGVSAVNDKQEEHDNTKTYKDKFKGNVDNLLKYAKTT
jgi:hypothetical protein